MDGKKGGAMTETKFNFDSGQSPETFDRIQWCDKARDLIRKISDPESARGRFLSAAASLLETAAEAGEKRAGEDYKALEKFNKLYFGELASETYKTSFADPSYTVSLFGEEEGTLLSAFYSDLRRAVEFSFHKMDFALIHLYRGLFTLADIFYGNEGPLGSFYRVWKGSLKEKLIPSDLQRSYDPGYSFYTSLIREEDLSAPDYLYLYDAPVSRNEIETARHFAQMDESTVKKLASTIAEGYLRGFALSNKSLEGKSTVHLIYNIGQERLARELMESLGQEGLKIMIPSPSSTPVNRQYQFDHKFDLALTLDSREIESQEKAWEKAYEENKSLLQAYSGIIFIDKFGETPFSPLIKKEAARLSPAQQPLYQELVTRLQSLRQRYLPRSETSFCIIAFPTPEIGPRFKTLFDETVAINSLDNDTWERLQQKIIDVMDKARYIHVKGKAPNKTDIRVMMQPLKDPSKETNFVNCTADVNIPVGEVFTSPLLTGTEGTLHLEETLLNGLKYENLQLHFKDGRISDYSCSNFPSEEENRKFIRENLMNQRETLPIGEFAIGTNTLAYKTARQYGIMELLPILIIEKMGPHFAVGDTCFSHEEDHETFNPDGKKITAVENEISALRKEDPSKAYTNCHTDITLPYESLEHITAVYPDGSLHPVIENGLFAIRGLEKLNEPLKEI